MMSPSQQDRAAEKDPEGLLLEVLAERQAGAFVTLEEGRLRTEEMIARKRADSGL